MALSLLGSILIAALQRVDVLQSSRHVRIEVNGVEVANTTRPRLLFETSLPIRYYIPKTDCKVELLTPSGTSTQCPYKVRPVSVVRVPRRASEPGLTHARSLQGVASYYHVNLPSGETLEDIVWWYRTPQLECAEIKGHAAFTNEKVDIYLDGVLQPRPESPWASKRASAIVPV